MNEMQIFQYQDKPVRTIQKDGEPWWVLKDVCAVLEISKYRDTAERLDPDERESVRVDTPGGKQEMICVNESGLYNVILRSDKPQAKPFRRWVTGEVLPSIRKHGAYATDELLNNPDLAIAAFTALKEEREKNKILENTVANQNQLITEMEPKASYCDMVLKAKNAVAITQIAKDYGMSAVRLNKLLHDMKIQYKSGKCWVLYQDYADKGYTKSNTYSIDKDNCVIHTYWTQSGRLFLYNLLKEKCGILPIIEK